jgi:hypothetical protein
MRIMTSRVASSLFALAALSLSLAACGTGAAGTCPGSEASTGTMTATIDGEAFEACITTGNNSDGVVAIIGQAYDDIVPTQVQLNLLITEPGTYDLGALDGEHQGRYTDGLDSADTYLTYAEGGGTATFNTLNATSAAGTFAFVARNDGGEVTITDGAFDLTFDRARRLSPTKGNVDGAPVARVFRRSRDSSPWGRGRPPAAARSGRPAP